MGKKEAKKRRQKATYKTNHVSLQGPNHLVNLKIERNLLRFLDRED